MKICYVADGISIHTQRWVNYFATKGHEVHLISYQFPSGYEGFDKRIEMHQLTRLLPQLWKVSRYLSGVLWPFQVRRMVNKIRPDILHAHYVTGYGHLGAVSGFHPLILSAWGSDILIDPKQSRIYRFLTEYSLRKADLITCDGENTKEEMIKLGANVGKIRLVYHGVDTQKFNPKQRNEETRNKIELSYSPTIISVRMLQPLYDVESLVKAMPLIMKQIPEAKLIIAGDGEQRDYLEDLAEALGISSAIRFVGRISHDELPKYLASADVYVSTSLSDGGIAVSTLEAMASGLPIVVTDCGDIKKWITDGENGFIVLVKAPETIAEKVIYLLESEDRRMKFGRLARAVVEHRADYEKEMLKVEKLYQELIDGGER
jgi:glycosyltransferase involved in cell wall biosynthesis